MINGENLYVFVVKGFLSNFNETFPESCLHQHKLASHHFTILTPPTAQRPLHLIFANLANTTTITITTTITTWQINPQIRPTFENDFLVTLQILRNEWGPTGFLIVRI